MLLSVRVRHGLGTKVRRLGGLLTPSEAVGLQ
jgi:hypothetical protein